jgi:hypothetical protein
VGTLVEDVIGRRERVPVAAVRSVCLPLRKHTFGLRGVKGGHVNQILRVVTVVIARCRTGSTGVFPFRFGRKSIDPALFPEASQ